MNFMLRDTHNITYLAL